MRRLTEEEGAILINLARRTYKNSRFWTTIYDVSGCAMPYRCHRCLICDQIVDSHINGSLDEHGLSHLKEKGLLVFI